MLIIQTSFWCWHCTKEVVNGSCSRVATSCFGMNKRRGSVCLAVGRHNGEDEARDFSFRAERYINESHTHTHPHTRRDAGILFWLSGCAKVVFPEAQSELKKIESVPANKKWNTTVCFSSIAIILKFYRALMESIKTTCVCVCARARWSFYTYRASTSIYLTECERSPCRRGYACVFAFWHAIIGNAEHE